MLHQAGWIVNAMRVERIWAGKAEDAKTRGDSAQLSATSSLWSARRWPPRSMDGSKRPRPTLADRFRPCREGLCRRPQCACLAAVERANGGVDEPESL